MIKKTVSYTNPFTGEIETEELYFNLNKAELIEMSVSHEEDFVQTLQKIVASNNNKEIYSTFKQIVLQAYGKRSEDGKRFVKSPQISEEFGQSEAFSEFIFGLLSDSTSAAEFVNGLMPADLVKQAAETQKTRPGQPQDHRRKVSLAELNGTPRA